ncbi:transcriptional regulator [Ralstonia wenshanensis]|uniref:transcriptional regulator n=1 Tax=Ralstonia wenshanensis TaxID=2842456 RepID=UPI003D95A1D0
MSPAYLSQIANGTRPAQPAVCVAIERATCRSVTRRDLRPSDWRLIWPELAFTRLIPTRRHPEAVRNRFRIIPAAASAARLRRLRRVSRASSACSPTRAFSRQLVRAGSCHSNDEASVRARPNRRQCDPHSPPMTASLGETT